MTDMSLLWIFIDDLFINHDLKCLVAQNRIEERKKGIEFQSQLHAALL